MKLQKRNRRKSGETLVEILVAILIIALSAGLFACLYSASMSINLKAREEDEKFYQALDKLESMIGSEDGTGESKTLHYEKNGSESTESDIQVDVFSEDGLTAYKGKD